MKQLSARIISHQQVFAGLERPAARSTSGSWLMWLKCPGIAGEAVPGQFVMVRCGAESVLPRPFSLHRVNDNGDIALLYAVWEGGKGTGWLSRRQAGDKIELFGPLGNGFSVFPASRHLLLVAGGMGIAPLRFLADVAVRQKKAVTLLMGALSAGHLLPDASPPQELLTDGIPPFNLDIIKVTEDGSAGFKGLATDLIVNHIDRVDQVFACGPVGMYRTMAALSESFPKLKSAQVSLEMRMACGLGTCYGCTIKTKRGLAQVCRDGPVFDLQDVDWEALRPV
ncbi:MAG: dihydroorotate dehydrogenase electron transfer subunit [Chloroflexi bacterium]|nr:dihydroorotate dehydrogenase electron transfer subunit [Chloroflexota bacterium]